MERLHLQHHPPQLLPFVERLRTHPLEDNPLDVLRTLPLALAAAADAAADITYMPPLDADDPVPNDRFGEVFQVALKLNSYV